ncbi:MAG TPA: helix-turn-helix domain-containing protein [Polyangia bacterium]|jgi:TetR/AcrR family transcriptional repressor of nem operon
MRRSQEDTAETRARIVAAASRLLRARGIDATSVADVMSAVGLTVGGFYRHFDSKEALVAEAIDSASRETAARHPPTARAGGGADADTEADLAALLDTYLSDAHRKQPGHGCPVAALCSEAGHGSKSTRKAFTAALERLLASVDAALAPRARGDRKDALFATSAAVGALVLARATHDDALAEELLSAVRERLLAGRGRGRV